MPSRIETSEQEAMIPQVREEFFGYATSTVTNRELAEASVRILKPDAEIIWICNPFEDLEEISKESSLRNSLYDSLRSSLWNSLWNSLNDSLWNSLKDSLSNSLWNSLKDSLRSSLSSSLSSSLRSSIEGYWWVPWLAFIHFGSLIDVPYSEEDRRKLSAIVDFLKSAFAFWVTEDGRIIICQKPNKIEVIDGKVTNLDFSQNRPFPKPKGTPWWGHLS